MWGGFEFVAEIVKSLLSTLDIRFPFHEVFDAFAIIYP
jgi:hypothetical protein